MLKQPVEVEINRAGRRQTESEIHIFNVNGLGGQFYRLVGIFRSLSDIFNYDILTQIPKRVMRKCPLLMRPNARPQTTPE